MASTTSADDHNMTEDKIDQVIQRMADSYGQQLRSPLLHWPSEQGLHYEDVSFPALDGVPLEGWFIPAPGSDKLIVANHPRGFSRAGMPSHRDPWKATWAPSGNGWEVDLITDYRILHESGYNVLTYDLRNHGLSGAGNGGIVSSGVFERRDVLGSLQYARQRPDTSSMIIGMFSRCLGANSTIGAMVEDPGAFADVRCLVACQPLTPQVIAERLLEMAGVPVDRIEELDRRMVLQTSIDFATRDVREWAKQVSVPTFVYQVHDDMLTRPDDVQAIYDNIPLEDKRLHWIPDSTARWDGYVEFQRRPGPMLDWFAEHMS